ncbi:hypothetical protein, partial [Collimonas humicola]|uniref:hypothetical protein n=1 Tax=Collimonas humicola TaxID=2825886 RepID=UPI001B8C3087
SHLDIEREHLVNAAIKSLNITRVIVAHRPETINSADRAIILVGGKVVQDVLIPKTIQPPAAEPLEAEA